LSGIRAALSVVDWKMGMRLRAALVTRLMEGSVQASVGADAA